MSPPFLLAGIWSSDLFQLAETVIYSYLILHYSNIYSNRELGGFREEVQEQDPCGFKTWN